MTHFKPVPNDHGIYKAMVIFRKRILEGDYNISSHANQRMVSRGINVDEIMAVVRDGEIGYADRIEGQIGGVFYREADGLFLVVMAPYNEPHVRPAIITLFRDGEDYKPNIVQLFEERIEYIPTVKEVKVSAEDLSVEDLELLLQMKKEERVKVQEAERIKKTADAKLRVDAIERHIKTLQAELTKLHDFLKEEIRNSKSTPLVKRFITEDDLKNAYANCLRFTNNGKLNIAGTAKKHAVSNLKFSAWLKANHPKEL